MKSTKTTKLELIFLAFIIIVGSFLRLYRISDTAMFLGDQGRDAIIAKNILKNGDVALIGPVTSVGNMYLGPFYYYFMVPWLAMTYPSPIGPAIGVAIIGILTIPMLYFITKKMFSKTSAVFASSLYTISSIVVAQSRFSWNPNLAPTVGLLLFYFLYQIFKEKKYLSIIWATICFAILIQLHYMAMITGVILALIVLYQLIKDKLNRVSIVKYSLISLFIFLISLIPLIAFDIRHNYINLNAFAGFFTSSEEHIRPARKFISIISDFNGNAFKLTTQLIGVKSYIFDQLGLLLVIVSSFFLVKGKQNKKSNWLLIFWSLCIIGMISLYSSSIFTHYISFSYAVSIILIGVLLASIFNQKKLVLKVSAVSIFALILFTNLISNPAFGAGGKDIDKAQTASNSIYQRLTQGEKYNIVLISGTGDIDAQNYRYFLETTNHPPVLKENRGEVESLYIIQEDYFDTNPVDSPIYEIVVFPNKTPTEIYTIDNGPTITVLKVDHDE